MDSDDGFEDNQKVPLFEDEDGIFDDEDNSEDELDDGSVKIAKDDVQLMNVVRAIVILFLLTVATIFAESVFIVTLIGEQDNFEDSFAKTSDSLIDSFHQRLHDDLWIANTLATDLSLAAAQETSDWPFITYQNFQLRVGGPLVLTQASSISFSPLLYPTQLPEWETYAIEEFKPSTEGLPQEGVKYYESLRTIDQGVYLFKDGISESKVNTTDFLAPIWQMTPSYGNEETGLIGTLFDEHSNPSRSLALQSMYQAQGPFMTTFLYQDTDDSDFAVYQNPRSALYFPIMTDDGSSVAASLGLELTWETLLKEVVEEDEDTIVVVVENKCGGQFSFKVEGHNVAFLGEGDLHNDDVDGYKNVSSSYEIFDSIFADFRRYPSTSVCSYRLNIYASPEYKNGYVTNRPEIFRGAVLAVFLFVVGVFIVYDCLVERRQKRVVAAAQRSDAIVRSLFPSNIRDRLYEQAEKSKKKDSDKNSVWRAKDPSDGEGALIETPKFRIKSFISNGPEGNSNESTGTALSPTGMAGIPISGAIEPIADLFPETTIMFGDISGFTAWSSEREPSQVFTLLETIYRHMDIAAKKLGVFKVETVGDCYVAATGIPDPKANHAEIMVRFARSCLLRIDLLTKELESQLGPGTAELAMRFGIHSGPVTAGVLRGQKARFQLFGDTMNTASRMESTGVKNKIQLSSDTAEILIKSGLQHWVTKRQDLVHVKGKGDMQTYWLLLGSSSLSVSSSISNDTAVLGSLIKTPRSSAAKKKNELWSGSTNLQGILGVTEIDDPVQRLIDWNVDVLVTLLKRVVANRIASGAGTKALSVAAEKQILGHGGLVLDDVQMVIDLPSFDSEVALRASNENVELVSEVKKEITEFVTCIASGYRRVAFHNFEHASHVILSANKLLKRVMAADDIATTEKEALTSKDLHDHTHGIGTDPLTHFAVVFSALIHDVGHPGCPNGKLAEDDPDLAKKYVNKSIAEQRSVDITWELLLLPRFKNLRACIYQNKVECRRFRDLVVNSVMATDIFDKELKALRNSRWDMAFHGKENAEAAISKEDVDRKATIVIEHIIQASDVSHTMQHWYIYVKWNERLFREMYFLFLEGRAEKDPSLGWYEGELWFFDNYVIPLARKLKECGVFGVSSDEYLTYALQNRVEWEKKGKDVCAKIKARADEEARQAQLADIGEEEPAPILQETGVRSVSQESLESLEDDTVSNKGGSTTTSETKEVVVQPGKLGIVIDATGKGPVIFKINPDSPLLGKVAVGDVITGIDGVTTDGLDTAALSALIASGQHNTRRLSLQAEMASISE